jgi:hypothetical protein
MNVVVDSTGQKSLRLGRGALVTYVNSSKHVLPYDVEDSERIESRVEWLYSVYVDTEVSLMVVEDKGVADALSLLGVPVVRLL